MEMIRKPEVLAPAGDLERLHAAVLYGADAVYLAGQSYGMRASQTNFTEQGLADAIQFAHDRGVRVYVTVNTLPRNDEIDRLPRYLQQLEAIGADAVIVSDIGVLSLVRRYAPGLEVHISTQTGVVNYQTCLSLYELGAKRIVLARELSLEEIAQIRQRVPADLSLEAFVHGAMCMSFSGRCVLSNYLTGRDANRGECAQPCRWSYHLMEEKRPGQFFPVFEDEQGTYILNAKDMCLLPYIDRLAEAGIDSFKIEGRAKSSYYVGVVTNAYRMAVDTYLADPAKFVLPEWLMEEVCTVSHRQYSTGFYFDTPDQYTENGGYIRNFEVAALVNRSENGFLICTQKNKFSVGDELTLIEPGKKPFSFRVETLLDEEGDPIQSACHAMQTCRIGFDRPVVEGAMLRREK